MRLARRKLLAGLGAGALSGSAPGQTRPVLDLADLGLRPGVVDAAPIWGAALARLPRRGGAVLLVPPGEWQFHQMDGTVVEVNAVDDLTIEGAGARLVFAGRTRPFVFADCRSPTVRGLEIDWTRPPFSQGEIVHVAGEGATVRIDSAFPVDGSEKIAAMGTYDRGSGLMARRGLDAYDVVTDVARMAEQVLQLRFKRLLPLAPGETVVLRHAIYAAHAINFLRCSRAVVEDVAVRTAPGMAVVADHCEHITVRRLRIEPTPDSTRLMTTAADGIHCTACRGTILIEDCVMRGMGDDCVNIHDKYFLILRRPDARSLLIAASPGQIAAGLAATPVGDQLNIVGARTLATVADAPVIAAGPDGNEATLLRFARDLPDSIRPGDLVTDAATRSTARIARCRFLGNRARGVLAHQDTTVEDCVFAGQSEEAVLLLPDAHFLEGPAVDRVTIRRNSISDVMRLQGRSGAVRVGVVAGGPAADPVNQDVAIVSNQFADFRGAAIWAQSVDRLEVAKNRIERIAGAAIALDRVRAVRVTGNDCRPGALLAVPAADKNSVVATGNLGLLEE